MRLIDTLRTHPGLRSLVRRAGLVPILSRARAAFSSGEYEEKFSQAMLDAVRAGDVVWDVGANVGVYTRAFGERVGPRGRVVAAEPIATTFAELERAIEGLAWIDCRNEALGSRPAEVDVPLLEDPTSPVVTLTRAPTAGERTQRVRVTTGDDWIASGVPQPNVIKIDVEGYEEDVVRGMERALREPSCRDVFIEVHFAILERRGFARAPSRLASLLADLGFTPRWVDASHLHGHRD